MAGSIGGGCARRVRRLEELSYGLERPAPSRTQEDARALDAEIREIDEELLALDADPDGWRQAPGDRTALSLEGHIAAIEKEV